jgi:hypothetical protein
LTQIVTFITCSFFPAPPRTKASERDQPSARLSIPFRPQGLALDRLLGARPVAHHQVPPRGQGEQEAGHGLQGNGQVATLPDLGRDTLPPLKLGPSQRSSEFDKIFFVRLPSVKRFFVNAFISRK